MAFFKLGKKKKEESLDVQMPSPELPPQPPVQNSPIEQVLMMKQQGYTNNQIVQTLQSQGYNTSQIFDAINQAGLSTFEAAPQPPEQLETGMQDYGQGYEQPYQQQSFQSLQAPKEIQPPVSIDEERIQEVVEAVIDEKWEEFAKDIRKVIEWKEKSEDRIAKLEQQILDLRLSMDSLTKSIMSKISGYDQNIVDVGTEIKAMEKVFQKVLPTLTESVNKLDRMTKGAKEPQQIKK
ncbi:hypothetical protein HYX00_04690 [Candidatus Woesearchaeota archaeon]|nr:hypothetical protein [Candidatus Woesearchaeota archaeon]